MYHSIDDDKLYDLINQLETTIELKKGKQKYDVCQFLDDISIWLDSHRELITEDYLPLAILAIGTIPQPVSAFIYGLFVGKALNKHKIKIKTHDRKLSDKETIEYKKKNSKYYNDLFNNIQKNGKNYDKEEK